MRLPFLSYCRADFVRGLLSSLGHKFTKPTVIGIDNSGAVALANDYISNGKTMHIERSHLKIREFVKAGVVASTFPLRTTSPISSLSRVQ